MPPKTAPKKKAAKGYKIAEPFPKGKVLEDVAKKRWVLGASIGQGGFGAIYAAKEENSKDKDYPYVVKIEPHENGPLFVEMHFYMRNGKKEDIEKFKSERGLKSLGMPVYLGSGSQEYNGEKYRFVVMEKFGTDLWQTFLKNNKVFPSTTVFKIAIQILDVLEYIHSRGYVHADVKGANILMGITKATINKQLYLVDFGLATKFTSATEFKPNPKKAHDGTIEYLSRDAHQGVATMRGDLEVLAFNMIQWMGCQLPWEKKLDDPSVVQKSKEEYMGDIPKFTKACFTKQSPPDSLVEFLKYISKLKFNEVPDYKRIRNMFLKGLESGDALGKPFNFSTSIKTPQKRKNTQKLDKSPARKVTKKKLDKHDDDIDEETENSESDDKPTSSKTVPRNKTSKKNVDEDDKPIEHDSDSENHVEKLRNGRGKPKVIHTESQKMTKKSPAKKSVKSKLASSTKKGEKAAGSDSSMNGYTDAMKEVIAKKQLKDKAKKETKSDNRRKVPKHVDTD